MSTTGHQRTAVAPHPPRTVSLTSGAGRAAAAADRTAPLIGLDDAHQPVYLSAVDGHLLTVAPPGMGTTVLLRTLAVQALAAGRDVDIIDVHHVEHAWARGVDGVRYVDDPDQVHRHLLGLAHQARGRAAAGKPGPGRLLLIENDGTTRVLMNHRADPRPNGVALDALTAVLAHGSQAGIQVVLACRAVPGALGHIARDLFSTCLLAEPDARTWRLLGQGHHQRPPSTGYRPGLWHRLDQDGSRRLVQGARIEAREAAAYARRTPTPVKEVLR
ncbi:hypothetical protein [Streptomyces sp. NBC_01304]|uniref:hypothetical protein n=1 Tax=Streptomyces sp. NBC_01304 TaxID=2903818 RepID=UPI002E0D5653|nr:hypothetical protein OG430_48440 [Streptomyces sp. NBC_01304]